MSHSQYQSTPVWSALQDGCTKWCFIKQRNENTKKRDEKIGLFQKTKLITKNTVKPFLIVVIDTWKNHKTLRLLSKISLYK